MGLWKKKAPVLFALQWSMRGKQNGCFCYSIMDVNRSR